MSKKLLSIPKKDGFIFPAEFSEHQATWMIWPERADNWRCKATYAQKAYTQLASEIVKNEPLYMGVSKGQLKNAKKMLPKEVVIVEIESDDAWVRDTGPTFVVNNKGELRGIDWTFNAWGGFVDGLFKVWDKDDKVASNICKYQKIDYYRTDNFVLEGGAIHTDGEGTLYVTEACLLSKGRNPHMSKAQIENMLKNYLNIDKVIWIPHGIYNDETNEHIDNILQVPSPGKVLLHWTEDKSDLQYEYSKKAYEILCKETDARGRQLEVIKLTAPHPLIVITKEESLGVESRDGTLPRKEGDRQAASYINHYIGNNAVYIPWFNIPTDNDAYETLRTVYPDKKIIKINLAREIILGGGNIHCITQQVPKVKNINSKKNTL